MIATLFIIGLTGFVFNRRSIVLMIVSIEIMLLAAALVMLTYSLNAGDLAGQMFAVYTLAMAGVEAAIGLSIIVSFYRLRGNITLDY